MKSSIPATIVGCLSLLLCRAELNITDFPTNDTLKWTNTVATATYRIETTRNLHDGWTNLAFVNASSNVVTFPLAIDQQEFLRLFRVVWIDAPPAQPIGDWVYNGYTGTTLTVTGLVTFAQSDVITGTVLFKRIALGNSHPTGSASFTNSPSTNINNITIPLPAAAFVRDYFVILGQMTGDEFWGEWLYVDTLAGINGPTVIVVRGRFSAYRLKPV